MALYTVNIITSAGILIEAESFDDAYEKVESGLYADEISDALMNSEWDIMDVIEEEVD